MERDPRKGSHLWVTGKAGHGETDVCPSRTQGNGGGGGRPWWGGGGALGGGTVASVVFPIEDVVADML